MLYAWYIWGVMTTHDYYMVHLVYGMNKCLWYIWLVMVIHLVRDEDGSSDDYWKYS